MGIRAVLLSCILSVVSGCAALLEPGVDAASVESPPFPECQAESYAFAGRGTLAGLGLVGQTAGVLSETDRPATIWVTRDTVPFDAAEPRGSRMLCFEFDDGSGGSEWPVDAAWQPPAADADADAAGELNPATPLLLVAVVTMLVIAAYAFRRS